MYNLLLDEKEVQQILNALGELPAKITYDLLTKIMRQIGEAKEKLAEPAE